ncbi:RsmE family RNA methyltransferase [Hydrogenobaculum acidophilum]
MHRFFAFKKNGIVELFEEEKKHFKILRIEENEPIELVIEDRIYEARFKDRHFLLLEDKTKIPDVKIYVNVCIPMKLQTLETIIDYAVQGGAFEITPVICKRGFQDKNKLLEKYQRFQKILKEAIKQSRPSFLPRLNHPTPLENIALKGHGVVFDSFEKPKNVLPKDSEYTLVFGPEGGLSKEELELLKSVGFKSYSLGDNILREELAVFAGIFMVRCRL